MYYTPQIIIDQINNKIFDPSAGTGGLLVAAAGYLRNPVFGNPPFSARPISQGPDALGSAFPLDAGNDCK